MDVGAAGAVGGTGTSSVTSAESRADPGIWKNGRKSSARMVGASESRKMGCGSLVRSGVGSCESGWPFWDAPTAGSAAANGSGRAASFLVKTVASSLASRTMGAGPGGSGMEGAGGNGGERKRSAGGPTVDRYGIPPALCSSGPLPGGRILVNAKALSVAVTGRSTSSRQFNALLKPAGESGGSR